MNICFEFWFQFWTNIELNQFLKKWIEKMKKWIFKTYQPLLPKYQSNSCLCITETPHFYAIDLSSWQYINMFLETLLDSF